MAELAITRNNYVCNIDAILYAWLSKLSQLASLEPSLYKS